MSTPIAFFDRIRLLSVDHAWARWTLRLVRWLVTLFITFLGLLAVTFIISRKIPIDPVLAVLGDRASAQAYAAERIALEPVMNLYE